LAATNLGSGNVGILLNTGEYQPGVREFISPHSMRFAVQTRGFGAGQLVEGSGGAFDGVGRLEVAGQTYAPTQVADFLTDGGRTVVTPTVVIGGLYVSRKITVPDSGNEDFARTVDVVYQSQQPAHHHDGPDRGQPGLGRGHHGLEDVQRRRDRPADGSVDRHR
jgi:hypothetical protein